MPIGEAARRKKHLSSAPSTGCKGTRLWVSCLVMEPANQVELGSSRSRRSAGVEVAPLGKSQRR